MRVFNSLVMIGLGASLLIAGCGNAANDQSADQSSSHPTSTDSASSEFTVNDNSQNSTPESETSNEDSEPSPDGSTSQENGDVQENATSNEDEAASPQEPESETQKGDEQSAVSHQLVEEVIEKINQATDNMYRAPGYYFSVNRVDEDVLQVEIRRDAPDTQAMANLVGLFEYDVNTQSLREKDPVSGEWKTH